MKFLHRKLTPQTQTPDPASHETHQEPKGYLHPSFRHWSYFRPTSVKGDSQQ